MNNNRLFKRRINLIFSFILEGDNIVFSPLRSENDLLEFNSNQSNMPEQFNKSFEIMRHGQKDPQGGLSEQGVERIKKYVRKDLIR